MTCIVGLVAQKDRAVWLGADSAGVAGLGLMVRKDAKVFRVGQYAIGITGSFRMGQLIQHAFQPPRFNGAGPTHKFMCTAFVDALRTCLKAGGFLKIENGVEEGGFFLVGAAARLYRIESDLQVGESVLPYDAIGCGAEIALGAMYATAAMEPKVRLRRALGAAEQFSAGVRRPFHCMRLAGGPA